MVYRTLLDVDAPNPSLPRGRYRLIAPPPSLMLGSVVGVLGGALVGGVLGWALGAEIEMAIGLVIGSSVGLVTGATLGRMHQDATIAGADAADGSTAVIGSLVIDDHGQHIGRVVSAYVAEGSQPLYVGVRTSWLPLTMPRLVPLSALTQVPGEAVLQIMTDRRVVVTAPGFPPDATLYQTDEEEIAQHYAPHGIRDRRWWQGLQLMIHAPVGERRQRLRAAHATVDILPEHFGAEEEPAVEAEIDYGHHAASQETDRSQPAHPARSAPPRATPRSAPVPVHRPAAP